MCYLNKKLDTGYVGVKMTKKHYKFSEYGKGQHCKSHISKLKTNDDPKTILEQEKMFYKNL